MRTNDERIEAMHRRAEKLKTERNTRIMQAASAACGLLLVIILAAFMPVLSGRISPQDTQLGLNGSIFSDSGMLGYIVIGIVAFALGITVTVFCYQIKKYQTGNDPDCKDEDREDIL